MSKLTKNQLDILDHTLHRAANRQYFGDSADMKVLVKLGLMRSKGKTSFCPDEVFMITQLGREEYEKGTNNA